jgi:putative transposase
VNAVGNTRGVLGVRAACSALGLPRATWYRAQNPAVDAHRRARAASPRALRGDERALVLEQLNSPRFADFAVPQVHATLLDEGAYLCSTRSMYRILAAAGEARERRDQLRHPVYAKPELLASVPNQVWSWDITKLKGPAKWNHYQLYVILDIYSRYVVGWMLAERESAVLAKKLMDATIRKQRVDAGQLTIHADRGSSMTSKDVAFLLADLGVTKTHSRPHVSNDNPYSEAHFKTLKYRPEFPERFGSIEDARAFCREFFEWYNRRHRHSGIAMMTPHDVHHGFVDAIVARRGAVLALAHERHPERFVKGAPASPRRPGPAWINPPTTAPQLAATAH